MNDENKRMNSLKKFVILYRNPNETSYNVMTNCDDKADVYDSYELAIEEIKCDVNYSITRGQFEADTMYAVAEITEVPNSEVYPNFLTSADLIDLDKEELSKMLEELKAMLEAKQENRNNNNDDEV